MTQIAPASLVVREKFHLAIRQLHSLSVLLGNLS